CEAHWLSRLRSMKKRLHSHLAILADMHRDRSTSIGSIKLRPTDEMLEALLLARQRTIIGTHDVGGIDRAHEIGGGGFAAAVVGGDEDVGMQLIRGFQEAFLGGFLDVAGDENRPAGVAKL